MYTSGGARYGTKHFGEGQTQGESQKNAMLECSAFHECRIIATLPSKIPGCIFSWTKMNQGVTRHAIITEKGQEDLQDLILTNNDQRRIFETIYRCNNPSLNEYAEKKFDELIVDLTGKSASDLTYKEKTFNDTVTFRFNWEAVEAHINKTESHYFYIAIANNLPIKAAANKSSETKATASKDSCVMVQNDGSQIRNGFVLATVRASDGSTVTGYMSADYLRLATQGFTESTCRAALN